MNDYTLYRALLDERHAEALASFDCGSQPWAQDLNDFIRNDALRDQCESLNKTHLFFLDPEETQVVGFVSLTASEVRRKEDGALLGLLSRLGPEKIRYPAVPALMIGRFAICERMQGNGFGQEILTWVRAMATELEAGCRLLVLQADKDNRNAIRFYENQGFVAAPVRAGRTLKWMLYDLRVENTEGSRESPS